MKTTGLKVIALALLAGSGFAGVAPQQVSEFLYNDFRYVQKVDSFFVCSIKRGLATVTSVVDSLSGEAVFRIRQTLSLPDAPIALRRSGDIIVSRHADGTYRFFDLSQAPAIELLGEVHYAEEVEDFLFDGSSLFFAEGYRGLSRYSVENYSELVFRDSSMFGVHVIQLDMRSDTLFALDDYNGILRFPTAGSGLNPSLGYLLLPFQATTFTRSDSSMILSNGLDGFKINHYDSSGFSGPFISRSTITYAHRTLETDSTYVILSSPNAIEIQSKSDPGDLRLIMAPLHPEGVGLFDLEGEVSLLTPSTEKGLTAYTLDVANYPRQAVVYDRPGPVRGLTLVQEYLYSGGESNPLEKFDYLSAPVPQSLGWRHTPRDISALAASGDTLYVIDASDDVPRIWVIQSFADSLPRLLESFGTPAGIDDLRIYPQQTTGRRFFVLRVGNEYLISRAEVGQSYGSRTARLQLGGLALSMAVAQGRIYHCDGRGNLIVSSLSFFLVANEIDRIQLERPGFEILPVDNEQRLLVFSQGVVQVVDISNPDEPVIEEVITVVGEYQRALLVDDLVFAVGPSSTGVLRYQDGSLVEIYHRAVGGNLVTASQSHFFTSDGSSVRSYEYLTTGVVVEGPEVILPQRFELSHAAPNPFNGETQIHYRGSPGPAQNKIEVYNILGQRVRTLTLPETAGNAGLVVWDGKNDGGADVATGVYFARPANSGDLRALKMIYLK